MEQWINSPVIVLVAIGVIGGLVKVGMWIGAVNTDRNNFSTSISSLAEEIRADIKKILSRLPPVPIAAESPLRLTDFGNQIAEDIKAGEWADQLYASGKLQKEVVGKSPYEIQEFCLNFAQSKLEYDDTQLDLLRRCAFDNGIEIDTVKRVLGIVLRDRLLPPELVA